jgi:hypothetical protein
LCLLVAFAYCWRIVAVRVVLFLCLFVCGVAYCWRIVGAVAFVCVSLAFPCVGLRALRFCGVLCLPQTQTLAAVRAARGVAWLTYGKRISFAVC